MTKNFKMTCPNCASISIRKYGVQKNKHQTLQRYKCSSCSKTFMQNAQSQIKNKSYPIKIILNSVSCCNLGYTQSEVSKIISQKHKIQVPQKTISNWLNEYKQLCTYSRLRKQALKQYSYTPETIIHTQTLNHLQPYTFKYHKAKLDILLKENPQFNSIKDYFSKITSNQFPNHIFIYNKNDNFSNKEINAQRASQLKFNNKDYSNIKIINKNNQSNELAKLALNLAKSNNDRHSAIQNFMLINDSTTIAVEMPVYLTNWDAGYYRNQKGFVFPLSNYKTPITGHIDILQIRNKLIHILDYKPDANKTKPIEQLTIYALALSRKLNLPLHSFKCAWFDENSYYEFFPLHAVYQKIK